ncbi:hypothetical protein [Janthinobacterium sp.]|uniref:hypothetical protein n=1 Tax=Janthinobacterium sp. TaxID=1871054 RepID=UPI0026373334|nr:hypothetical protein [Janthinobacterium sp.]
MKTVSSGDSACHNCGTDAQGNFCHDCGQATTLHMPSAREFLHEFIAHYVALEGKLWRTLAMLLFRPGALRAYPSSERLLRAAHRERGQGVRRTHG